MTHRDTPVNEVSPKVCDGSALCEESFGTPEPRCGRPGGSRGLLTFRGSSLHAKLLAALIPQKPKEQGESSTLKAKLDPARRTEARFLCFSTKMLSRASPPLRSDASRLPAVIGICVGIRHIPSSINQDLSREGGLPRGASGENLM